MLDRYLAKVIDQIDLFVAVSPFAAARLNTLLPAPLAFEVVRNPVKAKPQSRVLAETNQTFVMIGRLTAEKGCIDLASAAKGESYPIEFIGDGDLRSDLLAILPDANITGWLPREDVEERKLDARAVVFASRWYEASPLVVEEAFASGIPVIASSECAAAERVKETGGGLVYDPNDTKGLKEALGVMSDDLLVEELSKRAHAGYWADPPTLDRHAETLMSIYDKLALEEGREVAARP